MYRGTIARRMCHHLKLGTIGDLVVADVVASGGSGAGLQPVLTVGEATWALKEFAIPTAVSCIMSLLPDLPGGGGQIAVADALESNDQPHRHGVA
jgi:hypothetical protein